MFQQTIKNFNININPLNERNTVSSGDLVTGHVSFELSKQTKISSITMTMKGNALVHWSRSRGKGKRTNYSARLDFFTLKSTIMQANSISGSGTRLEPGRHMFPFTCQLPLGDFPSSFKAVHGKIRYTLTVSIHRPWHLSKDFVAELNFVNHIDTNQPVLWAPLSGSNSTTLCSLCCATGPISMTVSTERKAFTPGETVKIICDFSNSSSRVVTPKIKLQQKQVCYTHNKVSQNMLVRELVNLTGQPINPSTCDVHTEIMLTIPSSAPFSISNCSILEVEYFIGVSLCARLSSDLVVLIPIILCDTLANTEPPPYL